MGTGCVSAHGRHKKHGALPLKPKVTPKVANLNFLPDNLRWTERGTLLVAGQNASPERLFGCQARHGPCPLGFTVAELDPATLGVRVLVTGGDAAFGGATGALFVWARSLGRQLSRRHDRKVHPGRWQSRAIVPRGELPFGGHQATENRRIRSAMASHSSSNAKCPVSNKLK